MRKLFSVVFTVVLLLAVMFNISVSAASNTYTDTDSGVTFTVPDNWEQKAFTKDREHIDVKFVSSKEAGCTIIYGSTDMWSQMSASDKIGYTRSDLNNSAFTRSDIAEMYSTTADKISTVTYNGVQYFKGEINYTSDVYGVNITITMTQLVRIDNGWMYMFQFGNKSTHKLYSDFESLLKSVQYTNISNIEAVGSAHNSGANNNTDNTLGIVVAAAIFFILIAVIVIAAVASRKKGAEPNKYAQIYSTPTSELPNKPELKYYCTNCGQALPLDSDFCHMCGTKIFKEENAQ